MKTTAKLIALLAMTAIASHAQDKIVMDGSTTVGPIAKAFAEYYMKKNPGVSITVGESGSGNGAKSIINGTCDIANMSRPMKTEEKEAAASKKVNALEHVVAYDGLSVIVHPSNPIKDLTKQQVRSIYMGEIKNWKELGGPDQKIVVISRDTNSGTYETWETKVMKAEKITDKAEYVGSNGAIRQRVLDTPAAIGYVGLAFTEGVKIVTVDGIEPTPETVLDKSYPIARPLYMYTNGQPDASSHVGKFLALSGTPDGKKIIEETGFIPVK
jgi:phosphate transport system substrate-binding protein